MGWARSKKLWFGVPSSIGSSVISTLCGKCSCFCLFVHFFSVFFLLTGNSYDSYFAYHDFILKLKIFLFSPKSRTQPFKIEIMNRNISNVISLEITFIKLNFFHEFKRWAVVILFVCSFHVHFAFAFICWAKLNSHKCFAAI